MSKPLELTIHPPLSPLIRRGVEINIEQGRYPYLGFSAEMHVPGIIRMHTKRFTDPELAAEYWRAMADEFAAEAEGGIRTAMSHAITAAKLHRFATSPHYFEADQ